MRAEEVLASLRGAGLRLSASGDGRIRAEPRSALSDESRGLIRAHREELLALLAARDSAGQGHPECTGCANIRMRYDWSERHGRRVFQWTCAAGHVPLELAYGSERVLVAPLACRQFERFGTRLALDRPDG